MSNANLFRRMERAQDRLARASMPETVKREVSPLAVRLWELVVENGNGLRLMAARRAS